MKCEADDGYSMVSRADKVWIQNLTSSSQKSYMELALRVKCRFGPAFFACLLRWRVNARAARANFSRRLRSWSWCNCMAAIILNAQSLLRTVFTLEDTCSGILPLKGIEIAGSASTYRAVYHLVPASTSSIADLSDSAFLYQSRSFLYHIVTT